MATLVYSTGSRKMRIFFNASHKKLMKKTFPAITRELGLTNVNAV